MVDEEFKNAVNSEDIKTVRDKLCTELHFDHNVTSGTFRECMDYCKQQGLEKSLYEVHDGRELKNENSIDYYQTLVGQLCTNFSKERLEHAVSIAKNIWKDEQISLTAQNIRNGSKVNDISESGRVIGKETIISRRPIKVPEDNSKGEKDGFSHKQDDNESEKSCAWLTDNWIWLVLVAVGVVLVLVFNYCF